MAYNEALAERIRIALRGRTDVAERKMFGGLTFMVAGRMAVGVVHDDLMVRVGAAGHDCALSEPHTRPMTSPVARLAGWSRAAALDAEAPG